MANPQPDNFTRVSNELAEAFAKQRLSGQEWQVLWAILRNTYGWNRKEHEMSFSYIAKAVGILEPNVARIIKSLLSKKIIRVIKNDKGYPNKYALNKDYEQWRGVIKNDKGKGVIKNDKGGLSKMTRTGLSKMINNKERTNKEKINKERSETSSQSLLFEEFYKKCKESKRRDMHIIADYADEKKIRYTTKGQWQNFIKRNLRPAQQLKVYTDEQIGKAMSSLQSNLKSKDNPDGFISKWTLETLIKHLE